MRLFAAYSVALTLCIHLADAGGIIKNSCDYPVYLVECSSIGTNPSVIQSKQTTNFQFKTIAAGGFSYKLTRYEGDTNMLQFEYTQVDAAPNVLPSLSQDISMVNGDPWGGWWNFVSSNNATCPVSTVAYRWPNDVNPAFGNNQPVFTSYDNACRTTDYTLELCPGDSPESPGPAGDMWVDGLNPATSGVSLYLVSAYSTFAAISSMVTFEYLPQAYQTGLSKNAPLVPSGQAYADAVSRMSTTSGNAYGAFTAEGPLGGIKAAEGRPTSALTDVANNPASATSSGAQASTSSLSQAAGSSSSAASSSVTAAAVPAVPAAASGGPGAPGGGVVVVTNVVTDLVVVTQMVTHVVSIPVAAPTNHLPRRHIHHHRRHAHL